METKPDSIWEFFLDSRNHSSFESCFAVYDQQKAEENGFSLFLTLIGELVAATELRPLELEHLPLDSSQLHVVHPRYYLGKFGKEHDANSLIEEIKNMDMEEFLLRPHPLLPQGISLDDADIEIKKQIAAVAFRRFETALSMMKYGNVVRCIPEFGFYSESTAKTEGVMVYEWLGGLTTDLITHISWRPHFIELNPPELSKFNDLVYCAPIKKRIGVFGPREDPETALDEAEEIREREREARKQQQRKLFEAWFEPFESGLVSEMKLFLTRLPKENDEKDESNGEDEKDVENKEFDFGLCHRCFKSLRDAVYTCPKCKRVKYCSEKCCERDRFFNNHEAVCFELQD